MGERIGGEHNNTDRQQKMREIYQQQLRSGYSKRSTRRYLRLVYGFEDNYKELGDE